MQRCMKCTPIWIGLALALGSCGGVEEFGAREESNLGAAPAIDVRGPMTTRSDPIGAVYTWIDRTEAMIGRVGAGVVDQPARRRVLLYGGWQENGVRFDTWEWDGAG